MARGFGATYGSGSADKITSTLSAYPSTTASVHIWAYRHGAGGGGFGRMYHTAAGNAGLYCINNGAASSAVGFQNGFTTNGYWQSTTTMNTDAWNSVGAKIDCSSTANDPTLYINGTKETVGSGLTENTAPVGTYSPSGAPTIGNRGSDNARAWDGVLAEFAIWDVLLDDSEFALLSKGYSPLFVRPASLVEYIPLTRENVSRLLSAPAVSGTAVQSHPRIIMPRKSKFRRFTTAVVTDIGISPARVDLALSETAPTSILSVSGDPARVDLALSTTAPTVSEAAAGTAISPARVDLVLSPTQPAVGMAKALNSFDLIFSTTAPTVVREVINIGISPARVDLVVSRTAPTAQIQSSGLSISPAAADLVVSSLAPDAGLAWDLPIADLVISTEAPTVTIGVSGTSLAPDAVDLVVSAVAPSVQVSNTNYSVSPAAGDVVISGSQEAVGTSKDLDTVDLVLTTTAPNVDIGFVVDLVDFSISTTAPSVGLTAPILPAAVDLAISATAPEILFEWFASPAAVDLVISGTDPTVSSIQPTPPRVDLVLSSVKPAVTLEIPVIPDAAALAFSTEAPDVSAGFTGNVSLMPASVDLIISTIVVSVINLNAISTTNGSPHPVNAQMASDSVGGDWLRITRFENGSGKVTENPRARKSALSKISSPGRTIGRGGWSQ